MKCNPFTLYLQRVNQGGHLWCIQKPKVTIWLKHTQFSKFRPVWMILAKSTAVASQAETQNRSIKGGILSLIFVIRKQSRMIRFQQTQTRLRKGAWALDGHVSMTLAHFTAAARQAEIPIRSNVCTWKTARSDLPSGPQNLLRTFKHVVESDSVQNVPCSQFTFPFFNANHALCLY